jgi:hypothetical protein
VDAEGGIGGGEIGTRVGKAELGLGLVERRQDHVSLMHDAAS